MMMFIVNATRAPAKAGAQGLQTHQLDTRNNRDFGGAIIQFVGAG